MATTKEFAIKTRRNSGIILNDSTEEATMISPGTYRLNRISGTTFYFRDFSFLETDEQGFAITYIDNGITVLHGSLGHLMWKRSIKGYDFGFPGTDTSYRYFIEKVENTGYTEKLFVWSADDAARDLRDIFKNYYGPEENEELENILHGDPWGDLPAEVGEYTMYQELTERFPDIPELQEIGFGISVSPFLEYRYEMLVSVSGIILQTVKDWKKTKKTPQYFKIKARRE